MAELNEIDEIGAAKFLTPELVRSAMGLVKQGKIYSLGQVLEPNMPHLPRHPPLVVAPFTTPYQSQRRWEKRGAKNLPGTASSGWRSIRIAVRISTPSVTGPTATKTMAVGRKRKLRGGWTGAPGIGAHTSHCRTRSSG